MADIMGTVMGTGGTTTEERAPDPLTQQINQIRADQVRALLGYKGYENWMANQFMQPNAAYTPNPQVQDLFNAAVRPLYAGPSMSLGEYRDLGLGTARDNLRDAQLTQTSALNTARGAAAYDLNQGINTAGNVLAQQSGAIGNTLSARNAATQALFNQGQATLGNVLGLQEGTLGDILRSGQGTLGDLTRTRQQSLSDVLSGQVRAAQDVLGDQRNINRASLDLTSERAKGTYADLFKQIQDLGLNQTSNYIRQVATPQIQQQMALQGLEGGGAVDAAIARATAEYGMPVVQSLANLAGQQQGIQGQLGQQYLGGEQQFAGQYGQTVGNAYGQNATANAQALADLFGGNLNLLGQFGQGMQSSLGQFGQGTQGLLSYLNQGTQAGYDQYGSQLGSFLGQYGGNVGNLLSQYNAGDTSLLGQYMGNLGNLSGQYNQGTLNFIGSLPGAQQTLQVTPAQTATALFPLADYSGQLAREDLNRRQGLFGTTMTGLPYTPGGTVEQRKETDDIFKRLGGMAGSASGSFPAFATMGLA